MITQVYYKNTHTRRYEWVTVISDRNYSTASRVRLYTSRKPSKRKIINLKKTFNRLKHGERNIFIHGA